MKTKKQSQRDARQVFQLCLVDGSLDEGRVRQVVRQVVDAGRPGGLALLTRFRRLVRLDREKHSAVVESATPLAPDVRATIEAGLVKRYGRGIVTSFTDNPALIGGVRIKVGSDVYDASIKGRLAALEARF
jgi:F-type H+-transporting ATPase subunit delta